jgi:serine/threonine protein kinase
MWSGCCTPTSSADAQFEMRVAIKVIKRGMDTDAVLQRFHHERQILGGLDHPNIARLLDGGTTGEGLPYFVMEFVAGQPIDEYCRSREFSIDQRCTCFATSVAQSPTRISTWSCTGTSSPRTFWSLLTVCRSCSISASPSYSAPVPPRGMHTLRAERAHGENGQTLT